MYLSANTTISESSAGRWTMFCQERLSSKRFLRKKKMKRANSKILLLTLVLAFFIASYNAGADNQTTVAPPVPGQEVITENPWQDILKNHFDSAREKFEQTLSEDETDPLANFGLFLINFYEGSYSKATPYLG